MCILPALYVGCFEEHLGQLWHIKVKVASGPA